MVVLKGEMNHVIWETSIKEQDDKQEERHMLDQGEQEERNHVIWETSIKEQDDNKKKGTCFKPSSPQFYFLSPQTPGHKEQENKGTNDQGEQEARNKMIREIRRQRRRNEQD